MNKLLSEMSGTEIAEFLSEMADRLQHTMQSNRVVIDKLRDAAEELEKYQNG